MKEILSAILLSVSSNMDNILIGFSYGSKNIKMKTNYILLIGIIIATITFIAVSLGEYISNFLPNAVGKIIGSVLLIGIGILNLLKIGKDEKEDKNIKIISLKSSIILGIILSLNNSIIALAASINKINILIVVISTYFFSTAFLIIGNSLGRKINTKFVEVLTSVILIVLGVFQYIF